MLGHCRELQPGADGVEEHHALLVAGAPRHPAADDIGEVGRLAGERFQQITDIAVAALPTKQGIDEIGIAERLVTLARHVVDRIKVMGVKDDAVGAGKDFPAKLLRLDAGDDRTGLDPLRFHDAIERVGGGNHDVSIDSRLLA